MVSKENYQKGKFKQATELFKDLSLRKDFVEFLTIPGYQLLN